MSPMKSNFDGTVPDKGVGKQRLLFVMSVPPPHHGANVANEVLWTSQIREQFECRLVDLSDRRDLSNLGRLDPTNVRLALGGIRDLIRELRGFKPHAVYLLVSQNALGYLRDGLLIWCAKRFSQAAVVVHLHGGYFRHFYERSGRAVQWFIDKTLSLADVGVVEGKSLAHHLEPWISCVRVVPNGTDIGREGGMSHKARRDNDRELVTITYLSTLRRSKGIFTFLEAAGYVVRGNPSVRFEIAGDWAPDPLDRVDPERSRELAEELVRRLGLEGQVRFRGLLVGDDKARMLQETDIFVLPSFYPYEGHPVAIIEAMAFACPVVATAQGAIPETVIDGETGFIVDAQNPELLAERISQLVEDADRRRTMGMAARERYERLYTATQYTLKLAVVLDEAATTRFTSSETA